MTAPVPPAGSPPVLGSPVPGSPVPGPPPAREPGTGVSPVAAALARLETVHELPLHDQPDAYQAFHTELQNALAQIDNA